MCRRISYERELYSEVIRSRRWLILCRSIWIWIWSWKRVRPSRWSNDWNFILHYFILLSLSSMVLLSRVKYKISKGQFVINTASNVDWIRCNHIQPTYLRLYRIRSAEYLRVTNFGTIIQHSVFDLRLLRNTPIKRIVVHWLLEPVLKLGLEHIFHFRVPAWIRKRVSLWFSRVYYVEVGRLLIQLVLELLSSLLCVVLGCLSLWRA